MHIALHNIISTKNDIFFYPMQSSIFISQMPCLYNCNLNYASVSLKSMVYLITSITTQINS